MRFAWLVGVMGVALAGCPAEDDAGDTAADGSGSSSSTTGDGTTSTTSVSTSVSTTITTTSGTTDPATTDVSTTTSDDTTTDPTRADSSSTGDASDTDPGTSTGCTPGTAGCACDDGACEEGLECSADDVCAEPAGCQDDEFGDITTEAEAHYLGEINDDDGAGGTVNGVLTGPEDVDWFRYDGSDALFNTVDPFRALAADAGVRFCKFAACADGEIEFPCEGGAEVATSPDGRTGCCHPSLIHVTGADCPGIDDDMAVWIRIDQAEAACVPYAFDYHF
ncbi:MAG: hypothetical protein AAGA54_09975 [Myxococcota bacterium]